MGSNPGSTFTTFAYDVDKEAGLTTLTGAGAFVGIWQYPVSGLFRMYQRWYALPVLFGGYLLTTQTIHLKDSDLVHSPGVRAEFALEGG